MPYTDEQIENAAKDLEVQTRPDGDTAGLLKRYPKAVVASFDGDPKGVTEMDALVAYLQVLGTLVDFTKYQPADFSNKWGDQWISTQSLRFCAPSGRFG